MTPLLSRESMRGTAPPSGTSAGFRETMSFGYIDQSAGARENSSECLACMLGPCALGRGSIDDDVQSSVFAHMIANLAERVAAGRGRGAAERHARDHLELLTGGDAPRFHHRIGGGELDVHG